MSINTVWTIARKELRDALHNRWFLLYTIAFIVLSLALSWLAMSGAGIAGFAGYGRTAASLINLVLLIIPLMALTVGAQSIAGEVEHRTMAYLLAQPISRGEVWVGKYLGLALSLLASLVLGFGIAGLTMALSSGSASNPTSYVWLVGLAWVLSLAMLSVGFLISSLTQRAGVAVGVGLFLWLVFVFLGDLGLMGASISLRMPVENLFWASLINPLQVFKMGAILSINATLDVLGPAGIYGMQEYGDSLFGIFLAVLALWIVMPALLAWLRFARRNDF